MLFIVVKIGAMINCLRSALVSKFIKGIISDDIPITRLLGETKLAQNLPENILSPNLYGKLHFLNLFRAKIAAKFWDFSANQRRKKFPLANEKAQKRELNSFRSRITRERGKPCDVIPASRLPRLNFPRFKFRN